jgi:hypothetical protein
MYYTEGKIHTPVLEVFCSTHSFMELSPSWEPTSCAATQELPNILWNPKVPYRLHKSPPLALSWARSIQSLPSHPISVRSILILSTHLRLDLSSGLFHSGFPTSILYAFLFCSTSWQNVTQKTDGQKCRGLFLGFSVPRNCHWNLHIVSHETVSWPISINSCRDVT